MCVRFELRPFDPSPILELARCFGRASFECCDDAGFLPGATRAHGPRRGAVAAHRSKGTPSPAGERALPDGPPRDTAARVAGPRRVTAHGEKEASNGDAHARAADRPGVGGGASTEAVALL